MEFTLLGAAAVAVVALYLGLRWDAIRANAADCVRQHWDRAILAAVAGVFGGRVVAMSLDGVNPLSRDLLIVRAGVDTVGATLVAIAAVVWTGRRRLAVALDGLAPAALFGLAGWHAGCVVRQTCLGTATDLPWGIASSSGGVPRHPVELYAAITLLAGAFLVSWLRMRGRLPRFGAASSALAVAGGVRVVTEPLRLSLDGGPVGWYLAAVVLGFAGALAARTRISPGASDEATG